MRLIALLPELWVSAKPAAQLAVIVLLLCLGGCGTLDGASVASSQFRYGSPTYRPSGLFYPDPSKIYLTDARTVVLERDFLDSYVCAVDTPLYCECSGHASRTCECHC
jgi:hypothetical protein